MKKFMDWMTNVFAPKMNKIARNPWVAAVQESILTAMPVILIGSFATVFNILRDFIPQIPDISMISNFSFGLLALFLAYLIPATIMEKKKHRKTAKQAGMAGLAFFLMIVYPSFDDAGNINILFSNLGTGGMIASLIAGLFVGAVMNQFAKHSFFGEDSSLPDFITVWFDTLIPITLILIIGWLFTFVWEISIFNIIYEIFKPFISIGQSFWGFVLLNFIGYTFLYTFGISTWVIYPITSAICLQGIGDNMALVAAGNAPININTGEVANLFALGGGGCTLALAIMILFLAKSKKLKVIGKSTIVPSLCNINEPLVFGAPIAFNPLLMVPMWIVGFIIPVVTYLALSSGLVPIPAEPFNFWYIPSPIVGYMVTKSFAGVLLVLVNFAISWVIYYPFFKVYDKQVCDEEKAEEEKKARLAAKKATRKEAVEEE
ncbi:MULTISPECIES: PTS sugar transporter subunit IIC [Bacillota]|uniref:Permease IIC component n=1 Tax=Amedibacillus hominis TaxID=2897776 RepID=A0ABS9R911_9FIRM|nr:MULTISPECIES: PTS transporter subunit EIIC [Bacillota]MCH4286095.1 PTS transporter subunit EIIC [Amedibacillus hominis]RGB53397.1 PTS sugar transporter subunit IIC [Absiella sp. AM22-9]RGB59210.1 PTS sugar transporter subunit IIC [Absiella sp. AM10-20]RGB67464.1 PTS sugar transporter subunit IIC [Absiella sp. AM09-45]RGB76851.1 PTS sugar transporter subunit IIC [Absiella sp. AM09-50]